MTEMIQQNFKFCFKNKSVILKAHEKFPNIWKLSESGIAMLKKMKLKGFSNRKTLKHLA